MASTKICVGAVFKKYDDDAAHLKYHIIVGDKSGELATIYINTKIRYNNLPQTIQENQFPICCKDFEELKHDSFADCSTIKEVNKTDLNAYLLKHKGHHCGHLSGDIMNSLTHILNKSKTIEKYLKEKYGFKLK